MKSLIIATAILLILLSSCKKKEERDVQKSEKRLEGNWNVDKIAIHRTDTMGNLLTDTLMNNQGTVKFDIAGDIGNDVFNRVSFEGACAVSELVNYFKSNSCGDGTSTGGWSLFWDADPEDMRMEIWAVNGGGSYHRGVNISYSGKGKTSQKLFYVVQNNIQNIRSFYTWEMSK